MTYQDPFLHDEHLLSMVSVTNVLANQYKNDSNHPVRCVAVNRSDTDGKRRTSDLDVDRLLVSFKSNPFRSGFFSIQTVTSI
jgi:hypothetical protein